MRRGRMKKILLLTALFTSMSAKAVELDWMYHVSIDEITDEKAYYAAKVIKKSRIEEYIFAYNCDKDKRVLGVNTGNIEIDGAAPGVFRVDKEEPYVINGSFLDNMWVVTNTNDIRRIVSDLKRGNRLAVRLKGRLNETTKVFSLSGFTSVFNKIQSNCKL